MLSACKSFSRKIPMQTTCIWKFWKAHTFRRKNISSIPFTAIGTILSAPFVRTMNTLPNLHLSKDRCPTTKRCSVSYRPLNSRVILLKNSGASSAMKCKFRLTIFPWTSIKLWRMCLSVPSCLKHCRIVKKERDRKSPYCKYYTCSMDFVLLS